ncbi:universal stress protein [Kineococcus rubinsiae]|uniref:universal stress protein n=1 Tax=Kineococcus rubinsiae TaxID=2609562 RepID=UPI00142F7F83|nr:universal stress protein [Kineococcus rubinsiae]NIZ91238.1 universal stress protein [Kineococcus rubinsiae]
MQARGRTTVGFSGSGASRRALRWALVDGAATGRSVHVVAVDPPHRTTLPAPLHEALPSEALGPALAEELRHLPGRAPAVTTSCVTGTAHVALLMAAATSDALVLGVGRRVGPIGPGTGHVVRECVPHSPVPLVLVGPQAVVSPARRLLLVSSEDDAVAEWALLRAQASGLQVRVLTTWSLNPLRYPDHDDERRRRHLLAAQRHQRAGQVVAPVARRSIRADIAEGQLGDVLAHRVTVGDLVVVGGVDPHDVPMRTLRAPVVLVPASVRTVVLPDVVGTRTLQRS